MSLVHGQSHHHCLTCNVFEFPTALESDEIPIKAEETVTDFQCPKCVIPLRVGLIYEGMQVCFCDNCRGFVIPSQSLGTLVNELRRDYQGEDDKPVPIDPSELDKFDNCPACLERMDSHPYYGPGNLVLNTGNACKLAWLDHGELAKIVRAPGPRPDQPRIGHYESQALRDQFASHAASSLLKFFY